MEPPPLFLRSSLLPVPHGFSTREGGVSEGPFASLNLGAATGDRTERVSENLARLAGAAGLALPQLRTVKQVHGDRVMAVLEGSTPTEEEPADGLWTGAPGSWLGVRTADCVPLLLVDPRGRRVSAVHSGWRGTEARIAQKAVQAFVGEGSAPKDVLAVIGPCIRACCYEVSDELGQRFRRQFGEGVVRREGSRDHLDLACAIAQTLEEAGVPPQQLDLLEHCTACEQSRFFSHRRDHGRTGRHLSFVACAF